MTLKNILKLDLKNGKSEEEVANLLGNPKDIAKQFKPERSTETETKTNNSERSIGAKIAVAIGVIFFNLVFVIGIAAGLFGALMVLLGAVIAIIVAGITAFFTSIAALFFGGIPLFLASILFGIGLIAFGLLCALGLIWLFKVLGNLAYKYILFNIELINGGKI